MTVNVRATGSSPIGTTITESVINSVAYSGAVVSVSVSESTVNVTIHTQKITAVATDGSTVNVVASESPVSVAVSLAGGTGSGGVTDHSALSNLGYAASGHTGFAATSDLENYLPTSDYSPTTDHSTLGNLDYASAGHTGFAATTDLDLYSPTTDINYALVSGNDAGTDVTAAELEELSDGSETTLHSHAGIGQYRQYTWVASAGGGWSFVSLANEPVFNLEDLE